MTCNNIEKFSVEKSARKCAKLVKSGDRELSRLKKVGNRKARRALKVAIKGGDFDYRPERITGRDVS